MTENNKQFILNDDLSDLQDCKCIKDNYADIDTWYSLGATVDLLNKLSEENEQLIYVINKIKEDISIDIKNNIEIYPKRLMEYWCSVMEEIGRKND